MQYCSFELPKHTDNISSLTSTGHLHRIISSLKITGVVIFFYLVKKNIFMRYSQHSSQVEKKNMLLVLPPNCTPEATWKQHHNQGMWLSLAMNHFLFPEFKVIQIHKAYDLNGFPII